MHIAKDSDEPEGNELMSQDSTTKTEKAHDEEDECLDNISVIVQNLVMVLDVTGTIPKNLD